MKNIKASYLVLSFSLLLAAPLIQHDFQNIESDIEVSQKISLTTVAVLGVVRDFDYFRKNEFYKLDLKKVLEGQEMERSPLLFKQCTKREKIRAC